MTVASAIAYVVTGTWGWALTFGLYGRDLARFFGGKRFAAFCHACVRIHQELWLFAPPGILLGLTNAWAHRHYWAVVMWLLNVVAWWHYRNWPDENRWKKRGRKAKEKVAQRGGKLVVVPAGAS